MGTTGTYGLRYQELSDTPDGAALGANLAADVETELERIDATVSGMQTTLGDQISDLDTRVTVLEGRIDAGTGNATTNGSGVITIPHNLGVVPVGFVAMSRNNSALRFFTLLTLTATDATVQVADGSNTPAGSGANIGYSYIATS